MALVLRRRAMSSVEPSTADFAPCHLKPPPGSRVPATVYSELRRALLAAESCRTTGHRRDIRDSGDGVRDRLVATTALPVPPLEDSAHHRPEPEAPSTAAVAAATSNFLNDVALGSRQSAHNAVGRQEGVRNYLRMLHAPPQYHAPHLAAGHRSRCTTNTQDTDLSPSPCDSETDAEDVHDACASGSASVDGDLEDDDAARDTSWILTASRDGAASPDASPDTSVPQGASSFLFAQTAAHVRAGLGEITSLQFAPLSLPSDDAGKPALSFLACGTGDGTVWIFEARGATVLGTDATPLVGHTGAVADVSWSDDGRRLLSVGTDAFVIVWDVLRREKVRHIATQYPASVARFLPGNNNLFVVGLSHPTVRVYNLSTGMMLKRVKTSDPVTVMAADDSGALMFTGDVRGSIAAFATLLQEGQVRRVASLALSPNREAQVTSLNWQAGFYASAAAPLPSEAKRRAVADFLLVNVQHDALHIVTFAKPQRRAGESMAAYTAALSPRACALHVVRRIPVLQTTPFVRSVFSERSAASTSLTVATGSEDGCLHVLSVGAYSCNEIATLSPGFPCAVLNVAWDSAGSVIVAGTDSGDVLAWRRLRINGGDAVDAAFQAVVRAQYAASSASGESARSPSDTASSAVSFSQCSSIDGT